MTKFELLRLAEETREKAITRKPEWEQHLRRCRFEVSGRMTSTAGMADQSGRIKLSAPILMNPENPLSDVKNTILHEMAHCVDFWVFGGWSHGRTWVITAQSIGCNAKRCHRMKTVKRPSGRIHDIQCNKCGYIAKVTKLILGRLKSGTYEYRHTGCRGGLFVAVQPTEIKPAAEKAARRSKDVFVPAHEGHVTCTVCNKTIKKGSKGDHLKSKGHQRNV